MRGKKICTSIIFSVNVTYLKMHTLSNMNAVSPTVSQHSRNQRGVSECFATNSESHSNQSLFQFFLAVNPIANITLVSSTNKEFWVPKFKTKQPKTHVLSFLKMSPQPAVPGLPLTAPSVLHLVQPWIRGSSSLIW